MLKSSAIFYRGLAELATVRARAFKNDDSYYLIHSNQPCKAEALPNRARPLASAIEDKEA